MQSILKNGLVAKIIHETNHSLSKDELNQAITEGVNEARKLLPLNEEKFWTHLSWFIRQAIAKKQLE